MSGVSPCHGCALTSGACANREPSNALTALICVRAGVPFYCHETALADWRSPVEFTIAILRRQPVPICQGWAREVRSLAATGWFTRARALKRQVGEAAIRALNRFSECANGGDDYGKANALEDLEDYLALLELPQSRRFPKIADPIKGASNNFP